MALNVGFGGLNQLNHAGYSRDASATASACTRLRRRRSVSVCAARASQQRGDEEGVCAAHSDRGSALCGAGSTMNFFKRARTPEELVFKCCNAYEELVKPMPAKQAVRAALPLAARARCRSRRAFLGFRHAEREQTAPARPRRA
jgi:hypothetical protein